MRILNVQGGWPGSVLIVSDIGHDDIDRYLTEMEKSDLERLRVPARRIERAASRIAGKVLVQERYGLAEPGELEFTKEQDRPLALLRGASAPFQVSFTHSDGVGGAAIGETPVGVDIERFREIRLEMTRFYLSPDELVAARDLEVQHPLLHYWSAKEAVFKLSGRFATLLKIPLRLVDSGASGLTFDVSGTEWKVDTKVIAGSFVLAFAHQPG